MLYALAHFLRDKLPFLWDLLDKVNAWLFMLRFGKRYKVAWAQLNAEKLGFQGFKVLPLSECVTSDLALFFANQPEEAFEYFMPHGFDEKSLRKLQRNKSFLAYMLVDEASGQYAGYCFLRSFFHGKGFRGRMVDINFRGRGLGTKMNQLLNEVGFGTGLQLFETVSKDNVASYRSAMSASNVKVLEEMPDNVLFLQILPESSNEKS